MKKLYVSQSFLNFIRTSDSKVAQILSKLYTKPYNSLLLTTEEINYLTFRKDGTISYLPEGKELKYNDSGDWGMEGRQNGKPSKVIRKIFSDRALKFFKDSDFESFTNAYKAKFSGEDYTFILLPNIDIPSVYDMDRGEGDGSLNGSCMNNDTEYLDIYKRCNKLQILILKDREDQLCGRALIWKINDSTTLMDRVYVSKDFMYDSFISYAKNAGYWHKKDYRSYDNKRTFIMPCGNESENTFTINTDTDFGRYPYIDTFQYGGDGWISNNDTGEYTYSNTDGARDGGDDEEDNHDDEIYIEHGQGRYRGEWYHIDDCVCVDDDWYHEDDDNICKINGRHYRKDDSNICEINGDYYLEYDCTYCERDSCYYLADDCVYCEDDEDNVLRDEAVEIDGQWYHEDSDKVTKIDGTYYTVDSDEIEFKDGEYVLINTEVENN